MKFCRNVVFYTSKKPSAIAIKTTGSGVKIIFFCQKSCLFAGISSKYRNSFDRVFCRIICQNKLPKHNSVEHYTKGALSRSVWRKSQRGEKLTGSIIIPHFGLASFIQTLAAKYCSRCVFCNRRVILLHGRISLAL